MKYQRATNILSTTLFFKFLLFTERPQYVLIGLPTTYAIGRDRSFSRKTKFKTEVESYREL